MKSQISKLKPWVPVEEGEALMMVTPLGAVVMEALYETTEFDDENDENEFVVCVLKTVQVGALNPIVELGVALPGLCGHFVTCSGGMVYVNMN